MSLLESVLVPEEIKNISIKQNFENHIRLKCFTSETVANNTASQLLINYARDYFGSLMGFHVSIFAATLKDTDAEFSKYQSDVIPYRRKYWPGREIKKEYIDDNVEMAKQAILAANTSSFDKDSLDEDWSEKFDGIANAHTALSKLREAMIQQRHDVEKRRVRTWTLKIMQTGLRYSRAGTFAAIIAVILGAYGIWDGGSKDQTSVHHSRVNVGKVDFGGLLDEPLAIARRAYAEVERRCLQYSDTHRYERAEISLRTMSRDHPLWKAHWWRSAVFIKFTNEGGRTETLIVGRGKRAGIAQAYDEHAICKFEQGFGRFQFLPIERTVVWPALG